MIEPTVSDARAFGRKHNLNGVVIVFHDGERAGYVSWGHDKRECSWMKRFADKAYMALLRMWEKER
jgi:hypothetical protein